MSEQQHLICSRCATELMYEPPRQRGYWNSVGYSLFFVVGALIIFAIAREFLWYFAIVPAVAFFFSPALLMRWQRRCSACGSRALIPADSPHGKTLARQP